MTPGKTWQLLVFRDGRRVVRGPELLQALLLQIEQVLSLADFNSQNAREELIDALLRAGELECALADATSDWAQRRNACHVTDDLALALVEQRKPEFRDNLLQNSAALSVPERVTISPPEGFCYYALHPLDYADLFDKPRLKTSASAAAVIGIRTIGTTLSAMLKALFSSRGIRAERMTVRPTGHPFDRKLLLSDAEREWVRNNSQRGAAFCIVDEGPGLSGSSFLAVAEALVEAGTPPSRITLLPSSEPDLGALCAPNAAARWGRFNTLPLSPTRHLPADAAQDISCGKWRSRVFASPRDWPAVWSWTERRKYLSADGQRFFRFDGHGHYGKTVRHRSMLLAEHSWGPEVSNAGDGFSTMRWIETTRAPKPDHHTVLQLARYCAFRAEQFKAEPVPTKALEEMATVNLERALATRCSVTLPVERAIIADARMMPHEWISTKDGGLLKVDAAAHGDDHFYPGPTDIAWDIAGTIAEWKLSNEAADVLTSEYTRISGDNVKNRFRSYLIAYCAFRLAFTRSAAQSLSDPEERIRFERESSLYEERLRKVLPVSAVGYSAVPGQ